MPISISKSIVNNNAVPGTTIVVLTAQYAPGRTVNCSFSLTKGSAGFFAIAGNSLVTAWNGSAAAGNYSVLVSAVGTNTRFSSKARFCNLGNSACLAGPAPPVPYPTALALTPAAQRRNAHDGNHCLSR